MKIDKVIDFVRWLFAVPFSVYMGVSVGVVLAVLAFALVRHILHKKKELGRLRKRTYRRNEKKGGFVFGRLKNSFKYICLPMGADWNLAVFGAPGLGKTQMLISSLRAWVNKGSFLAVDVAGDLETAVYSRSKLTYDPAGQCGEPYDIFAEIDAASESEKYRLIQKLVYCLAPDPGHDSDAEKYYFQLLRVLTEACFQHFYRLNFDFADVCKAVVSKSMSELLYELADSETDLTLQLISSLRDIPETNRASLKGDVDEVLRPFANHHHISKSLRRGGIRPSDIEKHSIFLRIPLQEKDQYMPVLKIIITQTLRYLGTRPFGAAPVLVALDEYANLSIDEKTILEAAMTLRKHSVNLCIINQSLISISRIHSKQAMMELMDLCLYKAVYSAGDVDSQEYFRKLGGTKKRKVTKKTVTRRWDDAGRQKDGGSESFKEDYEVVDVIKSADLASLEDDIILFHPAGEPLRLRKVMAWKDKRYFKRVRQFKK